MTKELNEIIKKSDRYKNFIILNTPTPFTELFKNKDFDCVQLHSTQIFQCDGIKDIVGFCGSFSWINNKLESLDGDLYSDNTNVIGYCVFNYGENNIMKGIDILVDEW